MPRTLKSDWRLSVISPVYNEQDNIVPFVEEVSTVLNDINPPGGYEIILVNDGSSDGSAEGMDTCAADNPGTVKAIHLARNFGMEAAISAGLDLADGDGVIILDSDRQDDPEAFKAFVEQWHAGYDVVYAVRASRQESWLRRTLFWGFYRLLGWLANIELPADASNFALMDRKVVDTLGQIPERNRFLRGLRAWVGFKQTGVPVDRRARYDKQTRLGFRGQWKLAMNAIFAFSYVPLFLFRLAGAATLALCGILICWALYHKLIADVEVKAWASQFITTAFFGGINLLGIGIIGEYVARIHDEVKGRPNYIVQRVTGKKESK